MRYTGKNIKIPKVSADHLINQPVETITGIMNYMKSNMPAYNWTKHSGCLLRFEVLYGTRHYVIFRYADE